MSTSPSSGQPGHSSTKQLLDELDDLMQRMLSLPVGDEGTPPTTVLEAPAPVAPVAPAAPVARAAVRQPPNLGKEERQETPAPKPKPAPVRPAPVADAAESLPHPVLPRPLRTYWPTSDQLVEEPAATEAPPAPPPPEQVAAVKHADEEPAKEELDEDDDLFKLPEPALFAPAPEPPKPAAPKPRVPRGPSVVASLKGKPAVVTSRPAPAPTLQRPQRFRTSRRPFWVGPLLWANRAFDRSTSVLGLPGRWLRSARGRTLLGWCGIALLTGSLAWQIVLWLGWVP